MSKRIKSFLMVFASMAFTAFVAVVFTPQWAGLVQDLYTWLGKIGVPASVIAVVGIFISEIWKQILNDRKIVKAQEQGELGAYSTRSLDLY